MLRLVISAIAGLALVPACDRVERRVADVPASRASEPDPEDLALTPASRIEREPRRAPIQVEALQLEGEHDVFVLRGARGDDRIVFLHGLCGDARGYLESFRVAAAEHGVAVAPNGDLACPGRGGRSWSTDASALDEHVVGALALAGVEAEPRGVTLIGYSLGASRAELLAREHPERYDAIVLIGGPKQPSPHGLEHLRAAAMVAGERDRQDLMKRGARAFSAAGIPSTFFELPEATHGEMGPDAERVMGRVLDWLERPNE